MRRALNFAVISLVEQAPCLPVYFCTYVQQVARVYVVVVHFEPEFI